MAAPHDDQPGSAPTFVTLRDGARIATWTTGEDQGHAPVVMLHGGPGLWDYLEPLAELVNAGVVVHRFDQRECGRSTGTGSCMAKYVEDIEELRTHWGHERVTLVGHSFGAALALAYAATFPNRVAAVVYLSGVGIGDWKPPFRKEAARRRMPYAQRFEELCSRERTWADEVEWRQIQWSIDYAENGYELARSMAEARLSIALDVNRAVTFTDDECVAWAKAATCTVTFVHGLLDPRPAANAMLLAEHVPVVRKRIIEGAGHLPWVEQSDDVQQILAEAIIAR